MIDHEPIDPVLASLLAFGACFLYILILLFS
jgi:hypothetical protein